MARILWAIQWWQTSALTTAVPLAVELRSRGHEIVFLSTRAAEAPLRRLGFAMRRNCVIPPYDWGRNDMMPAPLGDPAHPDHTRWAIDQVPARVTEVVEALQSGAYDIVVVDGSLIGAGLGAEKCGVPWVSYVDFYFGKYFVVPDAFHDLWRSYRERMGLAPDTRPADETRWLALSPHLILLFGLSTMVKPEGSLPGYVHEVGPSFSDVSAPLHVPKWIKALGVLKPAILVSTSGCWLGDIDLLTTLASALEHDDIDLVATVPSKQDIPTLPRGAIVRRYVPHSLLLSRVHLVLCSAGLQITTRAALSGVPIIAVPRGGDGYLVARAAKDLGIARVLDHRRLKPKMLRQAVLDAMADPSQRTAHRRLKATRRGPEAVRHATTIIETFIHQQYATPAEIDAPARLTLSTRDRP